MSAVEVSVVVPVRDGAATITSLLDGLADQVDAPPFEVIVVDNGSRDATADIVRAHPLGARLIAESREGSYAARNAGIAIASGTILAFVDADCMPDPRWLAEGVAALRAGADLAGGDVEQVVSDRPSMWELYDRSAHLQQRNYVERYGFAATANLFVRADVMKDVGPFDASLLSGGDKVFSHRATAAGYRLVFAERARVRHHPRSTFRATWRLHRRLGAGVVALEERARVVGDVRMDTPRGSRLARGVGWRRWLHRVRVAPAHVVRVVAHTVGRVTRRP